LQEGIWTWAAIDADNRLIAGWIVGDRRLGIANIAVVSKPGSHNALTLREVLAMRRKFDVDTSAAVLTAPRKKTAKPLRTSPFLLKRFYMRTKVIRIATAWKRPSVGHGRARDN
jgi:hypothetical protein